MFGVKITQIKKPPSAANIIKQINFGTARGITVTVQAAQKAVTAEVQKDFTYRNHWIGSNNPYGIQITTANKLDNPPTGSIQTRAGWLAKQKIGGTASAGQRKRFFPYTFEGREYIAIPSKDLRPKGSTKVLGKRLWPENLKNKLVIRTKSGTLLLAVKFGPRRQDIQIMYILVPQVEIRSKDAFTPPIERTVKAVLSENIAREIEKAIRTAK